MTVAEHVAVDDAPVQIIEPRRGWAGLDLRELWRFRELLLVFTWRNILVRYKQTVLGVLWAVLQPVFLIIVFTFVFGRLAKVPTEGIPYPIFAYSALLPWLFFANALTQSSSSVVGAGNLISKVYFPRLTIPIAAVLSSLVDFLIAFVVLIGLMIYYSTVPNWTIVLLPAFTLLAFVSALGVGLWLSALNVRYRDVMYTIPFLTQLWFFVTPVVYSAHSLHEPLQTILGLNPMAGVVEGFRWALIGTAHPAWGTLALSTIVALALLVSGTAYFRTLERTFADVV
jgi:lipopolysaccharide transport system permease protein